MITKAKLFVIFNFLGLQLTWAACAYGATHQHAMLGVIAGMGYIVIHFIFTPRPKEDIYILLIIASLGIVLDHLNTVFKLIAFPEAAATPTMIPYWLMVLWCVFTLTLPHSLYWLGKSKPLAVLLGGSGGGFSYWLGHELGAIKLFEPLYISVAIYFIEWAIIVPLAFYLISRVMSKTAMKT